MILFASDGNQGIDFLLIAAQWVNFFLLVWLVPKLIKGLTGRGPKEHLVDARERLEKQLREAKEKQEAAEARLAEYADKLENLEREVEQIVESYQAQGAADQKRLETDADKAIERLVREADFTIRQETLKAQGEIRKTAVETTLALTEQKVQDRVTAADQRRLADEYVSSVKNQPN